MPGSKPKIVCRSVFRDGRSTVTKDQYTQMWIDLINRKEAGKRKFERGRQQEDGRWEKG